MGRETALALARAGANIIIHYRSSSQQAEELAAELRVIGVKAWTIQADFSDPTGAESLIDRAIELAGPVQILINNASAFPLSEFDTVTFDELVSSVATDAWAPFALGRRFGQRPEAKHIVNIVDTRVYGDYDWRHFAYHAAKNMLALFTKMSAVKLAPRVAVNAVAPGLILPPEGKPQSYIEGLKGELPLQRIGDPKFVSEAVLYLVTSEFITGQVIFIDGGRHIREAGRG